MKRLLSILLISIMISASLPFQTQAATSLQGSGPSDQLNASALNITTGAHIPPVVTVYGSDVKKFADLTGKDLGILMWFTAWTDFDPYLLNLLESAYGSSPMPAIMLTWQPSDGACDQKYSGVIPFEDIVNGRCDNYIRRFANALKSRKERFLLRFAHEMNIRDNPWWRDNPNWPALFVQTFRHVHDVLKSVGASNIELMWSPNYQSNPVVDWNNIHNYYPGDQYVDWIGLSGYNWYTWNGSTRWDTFTDLYDIVLDDLACHYAKPQIIAEIGTVDGPPTKAAWIEDAYRQARDYPFLRAIVWFNDFSGHNPKWADFRIALTSTYTYPPTENVAPLPSSSSVWTNAYKQAISTFSSTLPSLSEATPSSTNCGGINLQLNPGSLMLTPGSSKTVQLVGSGYSQDLSVTWSLSNHFSGSMSSSTLHAPSDLITLNLHVDNSAPLGSYNIDVQAGSTLLPLSIRVVDKIYTTRLPLIRR